MSQQRRSGNRSGSTRSTSGSSRSGQRSRSSQSPHPGTGRSRSSDGGTFQNARGALQTLQGTEIRLTLRNSGAEKTGILTLVEPQRMLLELPPEKTRDGEEAAASSRNNPRAFSYALLGHVTAGSTVIDFISDTVSKLQINGDESPAQQPLSNGYAHDDKHGEPADSYKKHLINGDLSEEDRNMARDTPGRLPDGVVDVSKPSSMAKSCLPTKKGTITEQHNHVPNGQPGSSSIEVSKLESEILQDLKFINEEPPASREHAACELPAPHRKPLNGDSSPIAVTPEKIMSLLMPNTSYSGQADADSLTSSTIWYDGEPALENAADGSAANDTSSPEQANTASDSRSAAAESAGVTPVSTLNPDAHVFKPKIFPQLEQSQQRQRDHDQVPRRNRNGKNRRVTTPAVQQSVHLPLPPPPGLPLTTPGPGVLMPAPAPLGFDPAFLGAPQLLPGPASAGGQISILGGAPLFSVPTGTSALQVPPGIVPLPMPAAHAPYVFSSMHRPYLLPSMTGAHIPVPAAAGQAGIFPFPNGVPPVRQHSNKRARR